MVFGELFERFVQSCPACVMQRALMENVFAPEKLDAVFREAAVRQYERELLFSTVVDLMSHVVCRVSPSVNAEYQRQRKAMTVSLKSLYDKLAGIETGTSQVLVEYTANQVRQLVDLVGGRRTPLLKGYRVRILDGNHLGKTEHRLKVLRDTAAGALPGQTLAVLDPEFGVIDTVIPCEDGHAQERSLLGRLLEHILPRDLIIDDRNFCTLGFLFALKRRKAFFITRQHGRMPWKPVGKPRFVGNGSSGRVYEQTVELTDPETGGTTRVRRVTVKLKTPTRDGDTELHLLTNLPASRVSAVKVAELYRKRWTIENAFHELTMHLRCELNTLGYPKAALFGFCVAVCAYNFLAAVKAALRGVHGEEAIDDGVSNFYLTREIHSPYAGMMVALPPETWTMFQTMTLAQMAQHLRRWAKIADLSNYPKHPRGPKKPPPKRPNAKFQHVSTAKLLSEKNAKRRNSTKLNENEP